MEEKNVLKTIELLVNRISELEDELSMAVYLRNSYKEQLDSNTEKLARVQAYIDRMEEERCNNED